MSAIADDEDDDPTQNPMVIWLTKNVPFVSKGSDQ